MASSGRRVVLPLLAAIAGLVYPASLLRDAAVAVQPVDRGAVLAAPLLAVELGRGSVVLTGITASEEHAAALRRLLAERFPQREARTALQPGLQLPQGWQRSSRQLLAALATTESATATLQPAGVRIRAVTANSDAFAEQLRLLEDTLPGEATVEIDVKTVAAAAPLAELCSQALATIATEPVEFALSSAELRRSSWPQLDRIVDLAWDCRELTLTITGHSDASGTEAWNRRLSLLRAEAVAAYLTAGGMDPARLRVAGEGSAEPVADNTTQFGRRLNRRIEFSFE